jgi:Tol biopolymer transport system component
MLAYCVWDAEKCSVVVRDIPPAGPPLHRRSGAKFDLVSKPAFSGDSALLAYPALEGSKWRIVLADPKRDNLQEVVPKWAQYDDVGSPVFSPNGKSIAYSARSGSAWSVVHGIIGKGDSSAGKVFDYVDTPVFSSDGKRLAYVAAKPGSAGMKWVLVVSEIDEGMALGKAWTSEEFDSIHTPVFSADGAFVACSTIKGDKWAVLAVDVRTVDESAKVFQGEDLDYVSQPIFCADGKKVAYGARKGRELWWKVMDVR